MTEQTKSEFTDDIIIGSIKSYLEELHSANENLLKACKLALPELKNKSSRYHPAISKIEQAIKKAEGIK